MDMGDLGRDLEHCLQLHRRLHKLRRVWAQVRGTHGLLNNAECDPAWVLPSSVFTTCMCLGRPHHLPKP